MSNIHLLPKEVLSEIFRYLPSIEDTRQCQYVCSAWYAVAHLQLLEHINIYSYSAIKRFIQSIDYSDENTAYLSSVQEIHVGLGYGSISAIKLGREEISKVLLRFPNLRQIYVNSNILRSFDDQLCASILDSCRNVITFEISGGLQQNMENISTIKPILTAIGLDSFNANEMPLNNRIEVVNFLASFPRLTKLVGNSTLLNTFEQWLPIFEHLPNVTDMHLVLQQPDIQNFAERYFATKTVKETILISERLANVKKLNIQTESCSAINKNCFNFIKNYMTGLENVGVNYDAENNNVDVQSDAAFDIMFKIIGFYAKESSYLSIVNLHITQEIHLFNAIERIFFQNNTAANHAINNRTTPDIFLAFKEPSEMGFSDLPSVYIELEKTASIVVTYNNYGQDNDPVSFLKLFGQSLLDKFNCLDLKFLGEIASCYQYLIDEILHELLLKNTIPFLQELTLDVSYIFVNLAVDITGNLNFKKFTLNAVTENDCFNDFLQTLSQIAPNLKKLVINNFCGVWDMNAYEYNLDLTACSLETLKIDISPVKRKTKQYVKQKTTAQADEFFVLEVCSLKEHTISVYKVPFNFSRLSRVDKSELQRNFVQGEDYISVKISIQSVQDLFVGIIFGELTWEKNVLVMPEYLCYKYVPLST